MLNLPPPTATLVAAYIDPQSTDNAAAALHGKLVMFSTLNCTTPPDTGAATVTRAHTFAAARLLDRIIELLVNAC